MKKYLPLILLLILHLFLLTNLRFTAWPEMLSYPYLRNHGYLLYKDMIHPYPPALTMALSVVYNIFGYKLIVLKVITWLIILVNDLLIFLIAKNLTKNIKFAFVSLISYILVQPFLEGNQLWFDLAIVPSVLVATYCMMQKRYFWSGIFFGVAALTKQTTALYLVPGALYIVLRERKIQKLAAFIAGPFILFLILLVRLITEGAVSGFFNWTLVYPFKYWSAFPGYVQMLPTSRQLLILALLILSLVPALVKRKFLLVTSYFLLSLVLLYPRFSFFHFQLGLAFVAILFGLVLKEMKAFRWLPMTCFGALVLLVVPYYFRINWRGEARFWGKQDVKQADIIAESTAPTDKIYLLGPHSGLYVLADRLPPKIWSDNFSWYLEIPGIQEKILDVWEKNPPKYLFTTEPQPGNWYDLGTYRPQKIVNWIKQEQISELVLSE